LSEKKKAYLKVKAFERRSGIVGKVSKLRKEKATAKGIFDRGKWGKPQQIPNIYKTWNSIKVSSVKNP